jgi:ketosteroid isomerase-like protein
MGLSMSGRVSGKQGMLERFYEALNEGDVDGAVALLAPEVSWDRPPDVPVTGTVHGREEIRKMWASFVEQAGSFEIEPTGFEGPDSEDADRVLVRVTFRGGSEEAGAFEFSGAQVFTVRYGGITRVQEFRDLEQARNALLDG